MKNSKIAKYLHEALNQDSAKKKAALKKIINKMKKKQRKLKDKLAAAKTEKERAAIMAKLKVNRAHRKKGVKAFRELSGKARARSAFVQRDGAPFACSVLGNSKTTASMPPSAAARFRALNRYTDGHCAL